MRYSREHKEKTKQRIIRVAGRLFRKKGYDGVGIDDIMAAAKLTRGGFYGYFKSKADLFAHAISQQPDFVTRLRARNGSTPRSLREAAKKEVEGYLHPFHRKMVGEGCELASLSVDTARASKAAQEGYAAQVKELIAEFERGMDDGPAAQSRAIRAMVMCVGGLLIARGMGDDELAIEVLAAAREGAKRELG